MKNLFKNKKKLVRVAIMACILASLMSICCFATGESVSVTTVITDLSTMVEGLLSNAEAVFGFLTSAAVLPWILLGVGVSLISVGIWWVKWIIWGR